MEAFSLLRYWRSNGGDATNNPNVRTSTASAATTNTTATTIVTAVSSLTSEDEEEDDENDHGPFFDLEFSLPAEEDEHAKHGEIENGVVHGEEDEEDADGSDSEELEDERELNFTLVSGSSGDSTAEANVSVSPSDDLFFKGSFVPAGETTSEVNSKPAQSRVSLMKSATKFRVMMLKFKKSKSNGESESTTESNASGSSNSKEQKKDEEKETADQNGETEDSGKSMTVKFKVEEVPIVSLFKRHNSSKAPKKRQNDDESILNPEEKKFSKETMQKYLRKVKPLYFRVSKRYGEKLKFTGQLNFPGATKNIAPSSPPSTAATEEQKPSPSVNPRKEKESTLEASEPPLLLSNAKGLKQGNLPAGLRVVCKHLGKSRSASTAVAATPPGTTSSKRRDDSLLQQQDGIQSAIQHCKRSFKALRDSDCSSSLSGELTPAVGKYENSGTAAAGGEGTEEINKRKGDET